MVNILSKLKGDPSERVAKKLRPLVEEINSLEPQVVQRSRRPASGYDGPIPGTAGRGPGSG